ncbi:NAD(P)-dependent dehydrogenase (short-subunit alcohol dehydrogenase family) [Chryseobacterium ginsenosidimutans]|uniref:SDR family NAD(P)-dependent oxidoreductase n=1 Tax=Chryseobacterium ginsenosidimutans TaxID=687846 RepID=UPI0021690005|nr:SDR family NAD(P)-dependent oxidoreductase [Chryseobacterium ginsenosidimutans]MCS3868957.1 NAD(P)-dependent dehydrogenase (short-subunit alcohol dehydrogenase family) [Chryseobacterium ginsenosidimutans]
METKKVWFVTGASKGLGLALVKKLLENNYRVVATTRNSQSLISEIGETSETFLPLEVNLTDNEDVKSAISKSIDHFGQLDVIVNNAGYGQIGTLEELSDKEARANFDINVFGTLNVIRNAMPYLRQQKSGHIFNISSVGGYNANFPGWGIYCATKFAVAGLTESLAEEIKDFGVKATVVYPGYFRTDFLSKDSVKTPENAIPDYEAARNSQQAHLDEMNGNQPNDPEKGAEVLIRISKEENPPVHLLLGSGTHEFLDHKIDIIKGDAQKWESLTVSTAI